MYKYVIKRILLTIPVLLGAVFLVFTIMYLTPGDPGTLILGITATFVRLRLLGTRNHFGCPPP